MRKRHQTLFKRVGTLALAALTCLTIMPTSFANDLAPDDTTRLVVVAEDAAVGQELAENDATISSYDNVYLLEFDSEKEAKAAMSELEDKVDIVEMDEEFSIATDEETEADTEEVTSIEEKDSVTAAIIEETSASNEESQPAEETVVDDKSDTPLDELNDLLEDTATDTTKYDIAVIDTGASEGDNVKSAVSVIGDDASDDQGHGTQMVSTIVEQNKDAKILSIKALDNKGKGSVSSVFAAIEYAKAQNVKIINLSIAAKATLESGVIEKAVNEAVESGIIVVGAAGNQGKDVANYVPGNIDKAIIVGSANEDGKRISKSNFGETVDYNVVSESTSFAAAKMSGFLSLNGMDKVKDVLNQGMIYERDYEKVEETTSTEETTDNSATKQMTIEEDYYSKMDNLVHSEFEIQGPVSGGGAVGGGGSYTPGSGPGAYGIGYAYVWYDNEEHDQGEITTGGNAPYVDWWLSQLNEQINKLIPSPYNQKWSRYMNATTNVGGEELKTRAAVQKLMNLACEDAIQRAAPEQRSTIKARVIGIGIEYQTSLYDPPHYADVPNYGWSIWPTFTDNTFECLFNAGNHAERLPSDDELGVTASYSGWNEEIDATKYNDVKAGETFKEYIYRLNSNIGKTQSPRIPEQKYSVHVVAVTEDQPAIREGHLNLVKTSANENITDDNACYSLTGAEYTVYSDSACTKSVGKLITKADGTTNTLTLPADDYWVKETKAPKGYKLNTNVQKVTVEPGETNTVSAKDEPKMDPDFFGIKKVFYVNGELKIGFTVSGAIFKMEYFDNLNASGNATKTWYFKSDNNGLVQYFPSYLASGYSSDSLYANNNEYKLPIGSIKVTEVASPKGLKIAPPITAVINETDSAAKLIWNQNNQIAVEEDGTLDLGDVQKYGSFKITKKDIETEWAQGDGNFADITIQVKNVSGEPIILESGKEVANNGVVETKKFTATNNEVSFSGYPLGKYEVTESTGNSAYLRNTSWKINVTLEDNGKDTLDPVYSDKNEVQDKIEKAGVKLQKVDGETLKNSAQGGASLKGAEISIYNISKERVKVGNTVYASEGSKTNAQLRSSGKALLKVTTNDQGIAETAKVLPYGTYVAIETKESEGYFLNENWRVVFQTRDDGVMIDTTSANNKVSASTATDAKSGWISKVDGISLVKTNDSAKLPEEPIRRDFEFLKLNIDGDILPYTPFLITLYDKDGKPVENHVFVVDKDGWYKSADKNKTASNVNSLDARAVDGKFVDANGNLANPTAADSNIAIWFGEPLAKSNDKGALLYGSYTITELRTKASADRDETIEITHIPLDVKEAGDEPVFLGAMVDLEVKLETDALDLTTEGHMTLLGEKVAVQDTVRYDHLDTRDQYKWVVKFVDKATGKVLGQNTVDKWSPKATSSTTYATGYDTLTVPVTINTTSFSGKGGEIVAQVYLYQYVSGVSAPLFVASHTDINDARETLTVPRVATTANDALTGDHVGTIINNQIIQDKVEVSGVEPRYDYKLVATIMDRDTNKPITRANGEPVSSELVVRAGKGVTEFTRVMPEMSFDSTELKNKTLVVYEELYWMNETAAGDIEEYLVGEHKEILDEKQSIHNPDVQTTAVDEKTEDHVGTVEETAVILDDVECFNLIPDMEYSLGGNVYYKDDVLDESGKVLHKAGDVIESATLESAFIGDDEIEIKDGLATFTAKAEDAKATETDMVVRLKYTLNSTELAGYSAVVGEELYHNDVKICTHNDLNDKNQTVDYPKVETTGFDIDTKDNVGAIKENTSIIDTVKLTNLVVGEEYTIRGKLVRQDNGDDLAQETITSEPLTFIAKEKNEEHEIVFNGVDSTQLKGDSVVVYENLYHKEVDVARHNEPLDEDQTIHYPEIHTNAVDAETGDHVGSIFGKLINGIRQFFGEDVLEEGQARIIDTVSLNNLIPGKTYTVSGVLMNKTTEKAVEVDGEEVTQQAVITVSEDGSKIIAENGEKTTVIKNDTEKNSVDGTVDLTFYFDASKYIDFGTENESAPPIVAFEELYHNNVLLTTHKDFEDEDQTVYEVSIKTTALDKATNDHVGDSPRAKETHENIADEATSTIVDTVHMEGLVPNQEYKLEGYLVVKEESTDSKPMYMSPQGNLTENRDEAIKATKIFTANESVEDVEIEFPVGTDAAAGYTFVVFELLYHKDVMISTHSDINDEDQSIHYPNLRTHATNKDTTDDVGKVGVTIVEDEVTYTNLLPDKEYTITGHLVYKEDVKDADGKVIHKAGDMLYSPGKEEQQIKQEAYDEEITKEVFKCACGEEFDTEEAWKAHADEFVNEEATQAADEANENTELNDETVASETEETNEDAQADHSVFTKETVVAETIHHDAVYETVTLDSSPYEATAILKAGKHEANGSVKLTFEIDTSVIMGSSLVAFEELKHNDITVAVHADINDKEQTVDFPKIGTTLTDKATGSHMTKASKDITLVDTVKYENLVIGREYTVQGTLMNKATEKPALDDNGKEILSKPVTFTAKEKNGEINIEFKFSGVNLAGESVVAFEELKHNDIVVTVHKEINDEDQTVHIPEIGTTATFSDGLKITLGDTESVLVDTVKYKNLIVDKDYIITATLMDKATTKPVMVDGKPVTQTVNFTPKKADGTTEVIIKLPKEAFYGITVVYEEIVEASTKALVAEHKDINDKDQTVNIPSMGTKAVFKNGSKSASLVNEQVIVDTVSYKNLVPGKYILKGTLMNKKTNSPVTSNGNVVKSEKTFEVTEKNVSGTETMTFTVPLRTINGDTVVFEELYLVTKDKDTNKTVETLVSKHKDITDKDQTVKFIYNPSPKTADNNVVNIGIMSVICLMLAGMGFGVVRRRRNATR